MLEEKSFALENPRGLPLRGEVRRLQGSRGQSLVFVSHGFKGFKDWGFFPFLGQRLAEAGHTAVSFNFSGSGIGETPTEFTELNLFHENTLTREVEDLELVFAAARTGRLPLIGEGIPPRCAVLGHSRGAVASFVLAERHPEIGRVVIWAGVGVLEDRYSEAERTAWRRSGQLEVVNSRTGQVFTIGVGALDDIEAHEEEYDPRRIARGITAPVLLVHGTGDQSVPISEAEAVLHAAARSSVQLHRVVGAGHTFGAVHPFAGTTPHLDEATRATLDFLAG